MIIKICEPTHLIPHGYCPLCKAPLEVVQLKQECYWLKTDEGYITTCENVIPLETDIVGYEYCPCCGKAKIPVIKEIKEQP